MKNAITIFTGCPYALAIIGGREHALKRENPACGSAGARLWRRPVRWRCGGTVQGSPRGG